MNKLSVAAIILGLVSITPVVSAQAAPANQNSQTANQQSRVSAILAEINAAAASGDEALVANLLSAAVKANPTLAGQIIAAFSQTQSAAGASARVNVGNVVNNVVASLQNTPGSESLIASILSSYTPAAGNNNNQNNNNQNNNNNNQNNNDNKPGLPNNNNVGGNNNNNNNNPPKENPNQSSPR